MTPMADDFKARVDAIVQRHHLLGHPFYRAWTDGRLDRAALRTYAAQYFHHVLAEPTYLSSIHARTPALAGDVTVRQHILDNLIDEERGPENHPALWKRFAVALGANGATLHDTPALASTQALVATFTRLCSSPPFVSGLAALYAFESQVPAIAAAKIDGLRRHYGLDEPSDWHFFTVHREADVHHAATEWVLIEEHAQTAELKTLVEASVEDACHALWQFLDGVWQAVEAGQ